MSKKNLFFKYFIFIIIIFFSIELITRCFVFAVTKNFKTFYYGFSKNILIDIFYLKKMDIKLTDLNEVNKNKKSLSKAKLKKNKNLIWAFGGSTTNANVCNENSSSWTKELEKINSKITILNLSENNMDSSKSLYMLRKTLVEKPIPDLIIWSHKFNEINAIYQNFRSTNNEIKYFYPDENIKEVNLKILKTDKILKSKFLIYKIMDEIIITLARKLSQISENNNLSKNIDNEDYKFASINFKINTIKAIELSKSYKIRNFIILSLPSRSDYEVLMKKRFFKHYYERIEELKKDNFVKFIDLSNKEKFKNNTLFCDIMHKTLPGNIAVAKILDKEIKLYDK